MAHWWEDAEPLGGHLLLDFTNTINNLDKSRDDEAIPDWPTTLRWAVWAKALSAQEADALVAAPDGEDERKELIAFRERIYDALSPLAAGDAPDGLTALMDDARDALAAATLTVQGGALRCAPEDRSGGKLLRVRLGLALLDFLHGACFERLKECGRCSALYLDFGRGRGRRWCRMSTCGNRAKTERHRAKR